MSSYTSSNGCMWSTYLLRTLWYTLRWWYFASLFTTVLNKSVCLNIYRSYSIEKTNPSGQISPQLLLFDCDNTITADSLSEGQSMIQIFDKSFTSQATGVSALSSRSFDTTIDEYKHHFRMKNFKNQRQYPYQYYDDMKYINACGDVSACLRIIQNYKKKHPLFKRQAIRSYWIAAVLPGFTRVTNPEWIWITNASYLINI